MLQAIHDKITGWVAGIVIILIAVPFIFWGIDVGFGAVNYAARVKSDDLPFWRPGVKISLQEVTRAYQNQLARLQQIYRDEVPAEQRAQLQNTLLEGYIHSELLSQHATALGYRVSDEQVLESYKEIPQFQMDGQFSHEVATRILQSQGISPAAFEADQRRELQVEQLQNGISISAFATLPELQRAHALESQQREVTWLIISAAKLAAQIDPDAAAIEARYEQNKSRFMTPETLTLKYVELKVADIAAQVPVTEEAVRSYYESAKDRFVEAERRRGRHILIQVADDGEDAAARKQAEDLLAKVNAGGDFAKLAREFSQDAGSAAQGGDLGWAERSFFVGPFADALFSMKPGEVRGPVRTQFGYHIIRLEEVSSEKQKSFEEARAELETEYRQQEAERLFGERQEQLADKAFETPDSLDAVASELGLEVREVSGFTRAAGGDPFGARPDIIQAAYSEDVLDGQNSEPIELEPGHLVVLRVASRTESEQKPLAAVREEIVALLKKERAEEMARKQGIDAAEQLGSGAATWEKTVADLKAEAHGPKWVGRTDASLPIEVRNALFAAPKPSPQPSPASGEGSGPPSPETSPASGGSGPSTQYETAALANGDFAVLAISGSRVDTSAETAEQRQTRARQAMGRIATGEVVAYIAELRNRADIDRNPKAFE